jgi:carbamoyl-phosphate synthase large subunit
MREGAAGAVGGATVEQVYEATAIDPWFLEQIVGSTTSPTRSVGPIALDPHLLRLAKRHGFSDVPDRGACGARRGRGPWRAARARHPAGVQDRRHLRRRVRRPTPYHYSSYDEETEVEPRDPAGPAVLILGSGPNRIGQGIEFDYSCVHATLTLREAGYETVMVNCNPETVSTDYDTADRLYFEPLTLEDVLEVYAAEQAVGPVAGVIVQLGGQTPLGLAARR